MCVQKVHSTRVQKQGKSGYTIYFILKSWHIFDICRSEDYTMCQRAPKAVRYSQVAQRWWSNTIFFSIKYPQDVHHFQLPGYPVWYHTKIRPGAVNFLKSISELYELHIFTMGSRMYAHTIARMLDPDGKLFAYRIRSRDECFNAFSKSHDMRLVHNNAHDM